jgi:plasmid maintenance system antidote protein VapI
MIHIVLGSKIYLWKVKHDMKYSLKYEVLREWKEREGRTWVWLARKIGVKPNTLAQQLKGSCGLSLGVALALEEATEIPIQKMVRKAV